VSDELIYCLGVKAFEWCHYNPLKPGIAYFSIGEAIASIALLFAFFQLATPTFKFRLAVRAKMGRTALVLFGLAFPCVVIAALIPSVLGYIVPVIGFPIFWEVLAGLLVVSGVSLLTFIYARPARFTDRSFKNYFYACSQAIGTGDEHVHRLLAVEVTNAADTIVEAANGFDRESARAEHAAGKEHVAETISDYAKGLLDLFSDEHFARALVDAAPMGTARFLELLGRGSPDNRVGYSFVQQVVRQALLSEKSMLHKEEQYYGLGHFKWFTRAVFGDYALVSGAYRPLQAWDGMGDEYKTADVIEKYGRALKMAVDAYFTAGHFHAPPNALWSALHGFAGVARWKAYELTRLPSGEVSASQASQALSTIGHVLNEIVDKVVEHDSQLPEYAFDAAAYDRFRDTAIYGAVANGIYEFLEKLAVAEGHDDLVRLTAIDLWMTVAPMRSEQPSRTIAEIQKRLFLQLKKKIEENLGKGRYPLITRILILLVGLWDTSAQDEKSLEFMTVELHTQLRENFAAAYAADKEKAGHMLPEYVRFDADANELVTVNRFSKKENRFKVNPLPASPRS
jgi:hypothetical protein